MAGRIFLRKTGFHFSGKMLQRELSRPMAHDSGADFSHDPTMCHRGMRLQGAAHA
jgi:hypothetical protein